MSMSNTTKRVKEIHRNIRGQDKSFSCYWPVPVIGVVEFCIL